jgi:predicted DNA-binding protein
MNSILRDYPIKIKLQPEEHELLIELSKQSGRSSSEILREALEYALRHAEDLERQIEARKLPEGESLFQYYDLPKEQRNHQLLEALVGEGSKLRCKLMLVRDSLNISIVPSAECYAAFQDNALHIRYSFRKSGAYYDNEITLSVGSILSVSTYNERTNQTSAKVPMRFEALTENEYLQILVR